MKKIKMLCILMFAMTFVIYIYVPVSYKNYYKEDELYSYYFYTDKDIRNAPKVSNNYSFSYAPSDGSQWEMSAINFADGQSTPLEEYLKSKGYSLYRKEGNGLTQIWLSERKRNVVFIISQVSDKGAITLTKETQ